MKQKLRDKVAEGTQSNRRRIYTSLLRRRRYNISEGMESKRTLQKSTNGSK